MTTTPPEPPSPIRVVFALLEDSLALDWAGPAEALRIANQLLVARGQAPRFQLEFPGGRRPGRRCAARSASRWPGCRRC